MGTSRLAGIDGMRRWITLSILVVILCASCADFHSPDLGGIYNRAARHHDTERNPIIVIPGVLGSKLVDEASGRVVWGAFSGEYANPETNEGARLVALPMRPDRELHELRDEVRSDGALDRVEFSLLGVPISLNAYAKILGALGVGGYRDQSLGVSGAVDYGDDHYTCFQFDYDWRRDIAENAQRLGDFIEEKRQFVQRENERRFGVDDSEVQFDIVAHSMGGLLARYYLRHGIRDLDQLEPGRPPTWDGAERVERLIMVGTPNAGSVKSMEQLRWGSKFAPILPEYPPAVLGTMPSVYQLLPRPRHRRIVRAASNDGGAAERIDIYDAEVWRANQWGLADPRQDRVLRQLLPEIDSPVERRSIALNHLQKCLDRARRFHEVMDASADPPPGTSLSLIAGDAADTPSRITFDPGQGSFRRTELAPGDGTVTRASALLDERVASDDWSPRLRTPIAWRHVMFIFEDHLGITKSPVFTDNVLYLLLEAPADH